MAKPIIAALRQRDDLKESVLHTAHAQATTPDNTNLAWMAWREVLLNEDKYPVKVGPLKQDGRRTVTIPIPVLVDGGWQRLTQRFTCTEAELWALSDATPYERNATAVRWQYFRAAAQLLPPSGPKRKSNRSLIAHLVARDAKLAHHCIDTLMSQPEAQWHPVLRQLVAIVQQRISTAPTVLDLTAWLIEYQTVYFTFWQRKEPKDKRFRTLKPPLEKLDPRYFAKKYVYDKRHRDMLLPATIPQCVRELERFLSQVTHV